MRFSCGDGELAKVERAEAGIGSEVPALKLRAGLLGHSLARSLLGMFENSKFPTSENLAHLMRPWHRSPASKGSLHSGRHGAAAHPVGDEVRFEGVASIEQRAGQVTFVGQADGQTEQTAQIRPQAIAAVTGQPVPSVMAAGLFSTTCPVAEAEREQAGWAGVRGAPGLRIIQRTGWPVVAPACEGWP